MVRQWWYYLAVIATLTGATLSIDFVPHPRPLCADSGQTCVSIHQCATFQTRHDLLRHRPKICGFSGTTSRVCCDADRVESSTDRPLTAEPITDPSSRLPESCGRPRATHRFTRFKRQATDRLGSQQDVQTVKVHVTPPPQIFAAVGGINAIVGKWPWMVLFGRWTEAGLDRWFCGGVLITDQHVLTAAHCLQPRDANTVGALIGDNDLNRQDEVQHQQRNVSSVVRHPHYLGSQNDLAVVRLAAPVELTEDVSPICLPPAGAQHLGQDVEMAGWGLLEFAGEPSDILQEVKLRVTDPVACETAYRSVPQFETRFPGGFQGTKVCASSRDGQPRDACRGDSGGPLMVRLENNTYQLVGVVSAGVGCGNPDFPGLYTKVSAYIDWIVDQLIKTNT